MAIINTSPDSFAGDGLPMNNEAALRAAISKALEEGADILDIGGQSTKPGAEIISATEEIDRVTPALRLAREMTSKPLSIDTYKPEVARAALGAGATMINDVRGAENPKIVEVARDAGCEIVIMHSRGEPKTMGSMTEYPKGVVTEVCEFLQRRAQELIEAGIAKENIIVDPGIGFAKTAAQSMELTRELEKVAALGYPVLYGASLKSFLGKTLDSEEKPAPLEERVAGTIVVQSYAMLHGAAIVRVHDVKSAVQTRTIVEALKNS